MRRSALLMDEWETSAYDGPPVFDEEPLEDLLEEHVNGDMGPMLVIRRSCLAPKSPAVVDLQRHHIFESTCTFGVRFVTLLLIRVLVKMLLSLMLFVN